jgi:hypothetical protein
VIREKKITIIIVLLVIAGLAIVQYGSFTKNYSALSKVLIKPRLEWELNRTINGNLSTILIDNVLNSVQTYSVTEFQRGDVVEFIINENLLKTGYIQVGDTIGYVFSNEEQRKMIELEGNLKILESEYIYFTTGQKPEDVEMALKQLELAEKELITQRKLMARSELLFQDSVISQQQYDIDLNDFVVKEMSYEIALANYQSVITGDKPEQAALIETKIKALKDQIAQVKERIEFFTLISPVEGTISVGRSAIQNETIQRSETLLKIVDARGKIGVAPILLKDINFFEVGDSAILVNENIGARLISKDNSAMPNPIQSLIFLTFAIDDPEGLLPGTMTDIRLFGAELSIKDYLIHLFTK